MNEGKYKRMKYWDIGILLKLVWYIVRICSHLFVCFFGSVEAKIIVVLYNTYLTVRQRLNT